MSSPSKYSDEGTIAHALAAMCLVGGTDAAAYVGRIIEAEDYEHAKLSPSNAHRWMRCPGSYALERGQEFVERKFSLPVTEEMAADVQMYVDMVRARIEARRLAGAVEVSVFVERSLQVGHITGEEGATGTGDVVLVSVWADGTALLDCVDLKFGQGVAVEAEDNEQLQLYALGALHELELLYDFRRACLTIHQPRIKPEPSDWEVTAEELVQFAAHAKERAFHALATLEEQPEALVHHLRPGEKQCRFCSAKATCPKLAQRVQEVIGADFADLTGQNPENAPPLVEALIPRDATLAEKMAAADLIEDFCRAVRAEVERRLLAGDAVSGFKLVEGKRGARKWTDEDVATTALKSFRLKHDQMYSYKLISPTQAEKLLKAEPKRWKKLEALIVQSSGSPSVAPEADKRPALVVSKVEDDFEALV